MQHLGPYRLEGELGRGGMGVVHLARDTRNGQQVALKVIRGAFGPEEIARFRREGEALLGVEHPNLVKVHEVGVDPPYLALEYVAGESLGERVRREGPLPWQEASRLVVQLAAGVAAVHQRGLLHRDIKPDNVLLAGGKVKLGDFGLVKDFSRDSLTQTGTIVGSPGYLAPEQVVLDKRELGAPTDVYGLAATLFFALTGSAPFRGRTVVATLDAVLNTAPPSVRCARADVPPWLDAICSRGLAKRPAERFPSAIAFRAALLGGLAGPSERRLGVALLAGALASLGLVVLGVGLAWGTRAADDSAEGASDRRTAPPSVGERAEEHWAQARALRDQGDDEAALVELGRVLELDPGHLDARRARAGVLGRLKRYEDALVDLERALDLAPSDAGLWLERGRYLSARRRLPEAVEALSRAIELDPDDPIAYRDRGALNWKLGRQQASQDDHEHAVALNPADPDLYMNRAAVRYALGLNEEALADLERVLELDPENTTALERMGHSLIEAERWERALPVYERILELAPDDGNAWAWRGTILAALERREEALVAFDRALEKYPEIPKVHGKRGRLLLKLGRAEEALRDLDEAIRRDPVPGAYVTRAKARVELDDLEGGLEDYTRYLELVPESGETYLLRGMLQQKLGRLSERRADFTRAVEVSPSAQVFAFRGECFRRLGQPERGLADLDRAVGLAPSSARYRVVRGQLLEALGNDERALADYRLALELGLPRAEVRATHEAIARLERR